jgi:hypothetical protein
MAMAFSSCSWYKLFSLFKQLLPDFSLANPQVLIELVECVAAVGTRILGLLSTNHFVGVERVLIVDLVRAEEVPHARVGMVKRFVAARIWAPCSFVAF